ncbi:MAG: carboxy-S-adenosyl-L-methionine synthase CmoA [Desulfobacteraceae bacterium]|nr:carboxy-S-adenosyl-L-methionine synthase CmoA [Desulfobacteraceae bacterium]
MSEDTLYKTPKNLISPFKFDEQVARVFDDMIHRSVPFYAEVMRRQAELIARHLQSGNRIYDLGCSTGNLAIALCYYLPDMSYKIIAVDNSEPMLDQFRQRLAKTPACERIELRCRNLETLEIENADVVVLNYTMQFLPIEFRKTLLLKIYQGLRPGGMFVFCEKITHSNPVVAGIQQSFYHAYKRENGYSDLEISQKREALEKVLIPETVETHLGRLKQAGFQTADIWHKWFNFAAFLTFKQ